MKYAETVLDLVGNTPLVKLNSVTDGIQATILAKIEYLNPGGSSKDRIAARIIDAAEREGKLAPGGTIVEPTSGNTGIGLALVAQQRGYRCVFVLPDKVGEDKRNVLLAYGAEIVVTPTSVAPESPDSYYSVSDRLVTEIPGAFKPDQYSNPNGPLSHYETTGPEIWRDTDGKVTHYVAGVGTGGTISGAGKYLKEQNPDIKVIGADPEGSVYSGGTGRPYLVEGVGEDFWPTAYDPSVVDEIIASSDAESFEITRRLAREEGLLVGGSSGLAVSAALKAAKDLPADVVVVVLLPDGGRGYLGKVFNDKWMRSYGFLPAESGATVADVVGAKEGDLPDLIHVHPSDTVRHTIDKMRRYDISQMPVLTAEPPVVMGEVMGSIDEKALVDAVFSGRAQLTDSLEAFVSPPLKLIGVNESVEAARESLATVDALLVVDDGKPAGVLTRHDLLTFLGA
ncbi:cystathionine beta-synthase [Pseudolysinimonas yzui]|uniref:Cystathionine beta-synthase n=1 Tax=Pseudolysinimonas yzui TaxID=2708254 RepID=A0A8J3GQ02_9MICO|nr:cystathionine beta-synthase [Pseudolysinimonas yzui]GHF14191.1 putative cystathionine beta-synthase [Pseudolysinimonas yzui]